MSGIDHGAVRLALEAVGRQGPLPAERVVRVLEQVCQSLAGAHAHGVIDRDIEPASCAAEAGCMARVVGSWRSLLIAAK
jgi:hypothetical protein